jgi:protein-L-isoaspartate(D-aspartate) O-methyltransferase
MLGGGTDITPGATSALAQSRQALLDAVRRDGLPADVIRAMAGVPREEFVPFELRRYAYVDEALPIGAGQTISQPSLVARMTAALRLRSSDRVLEVGTGSGYQAAVLSLLAAEVVTVERVPELTATARERLQRLGFLNVRVMQATEALGWPPLAPYDAVLVAAAAPALPQSLVAQLAEGGRMVAPVGGRGGQMLLRVVRAGGAVETEELGYCRFVPLIGEDAWPDDDAAIRRDNTPHAGLPSI